MKEFNSFVLASERLAEMLIRGICKLRDFYYGISAMIEVSFFTICSIINENL